MSPPTISMPASMRRPNRMRWVVGGSVLAIVILALLAPMVVATVIQARLAARLGTDVQVGDVDFDLMLPGLTVAGVEFVVRESIDVELPEVLVAWSWRTVLRGAPPVIEVRGPHLRVRIDPRNLPEPQQREPVSFSGFQSIRVEGGYVAVELQTLHEPLLLEVTDIQATLRNTSRFSDDLTTRLEASASVGSEGRLRVGGSFVPSNPQSSWGVEFTLEKFDVVALNPLWNSILEMDLSEGSLSLRGELSLDKRRLRGRIEPKFTDLRMLDHDEAARHPMGEAIFSEMLSGAENAVVFNVSTDGGGDGEGSLAELMVADWESVIERLIQRGYKRQLDTLVGYESVIGGVDVDFSEGLLVLRDVSLIRDTGLVEVPFLHVEELEVRFDESVVDANIDSYKHIVLRKPVLTFVAHDDQERRQMEFDPQWPTKVSSLPFQTADLRIEDGTLRFIEHRGEQIDEVSILNIQLSGERMARNQSPPGERQATIEGSGMVLGSSMARVSVAYEPMSEKGNTHFEFELDPLPLAILNPLARTHAGIDASGGTIGISATFDSSEGVVKAEVTLQALAVQLIGEDEKSIEHPVRELLLTSRIRNLDGKQLGVEFERDYDTGLLPQVGMALLRKALDRN